jgi:hypothetical protein
VALYRVQAVPFGIAQIVQQVNTSGKHAEEEKGRANFQQSARICEPVHEQNRGEDNEILRPLLRTKAEEDRANHLFGGPMKAAGLQITET